MNTSRLPVWAQPVDILDLLRLSGPIAISRMSMMLMSVTDAIVLGQNAPSELPFILNAWLPMGISLGFGMGILLGVQVLTSELMGVGEASQSGRIFRRGFWIALALGLGLGLTVYFGAEPLFVWLYETVSPGRDISATMTSGEIARETASATRIMALGMPGFMLSTVAGYYLEALRRPLVVTVVSYIGVMVNVVIDLALVAGWWGIPQMGADGVAWATIGSRTAIMVVLLAAAVWLTPALKPSAPGPADEPTRQVRVGIGTAISNIAEWGGFNFTFVIATWISVVAGTVYGYSVQIMGLAFMFFLGIGTATSVRVAEAFGANLVFARLTGHGRSGAALGAARAGDWVEDAEAFLAVARAVGESVVVIGTSTGATVAAYVLAEAEHAEDVAATVFISPNIEVANPAGPLLELAGARVWVPWIAGAERSFEPINAGQATYWTTRYPTVATVSMGTLLRETRARDYSGVDIPALFMFADTDQVISAPAARRFAQGWGGETTLIPVAVPEEGGDPFHHVIAGDILSPALTDRAVEDITNWLRETLN